MKPRNTLLIIGAVLTLAAVLFFYLYHRQSFSFKAWQYYACVYRHFVAEYYVIAVSIYLLGVVAVVLSGLPLFIPLTLIGGYLFGLIRGTLFVVIAANVGAIASFLMVRYLLSDMFASRYHVQLARFKQRIAHSGATYMLTLHLAMVFPYIVINTLAALSGLPLYTFVWTTLVGSLPFIVLTVLAGQQLQIMTSTQRVISPYVWGFFLLVALVLIVVTIVRNRTRTD